MKEFHSLPFIRPILPLNRFDDYSHLPPLQRCFYTYILNKHSNIFVVRFMEVTRTMLLQFVTFLLVGCLLISQSSYAATQGKLGSTSSGSLAIRLIIHPNIQAKLAKAADVALNATSHIARFNRKESLCIRGSGIDRYTITARGSGSDGQFHLADAEQTIRYNVNFWTGKKTSHSFSSQGRGKTVSVNSKAINCSNNPHTFSVNLAPTSKIRNFLKGTLGFTIMAE